MLAVAALCLRHKIEAAQWPDVTTVPLHPQRHCFTAMFVVVIGRACLYALRSIIYLCSELVQRPKFLLNGPLQLPRGWLIVLQQQQHATHWHSRCSRHTSVSTCQGFQSLHAFQLTAVLPKGCTPSHDVTTGAAWIKRGRRPYLGRSQVLPENAVVDVPCNTARLHRVGHLEITGRDSRDADSSRDVLW